MRFRVIRSNVLPIWFAVLGLIGSQGVGFAEDVGKAAGKADAAKADPAKAAASPLKSDAPKFRSRFAICWKIANIRRQLRRSMRR